MEKTINRHRNKPLNMLQIFGLAMAILTLGFCILASVDPATSRGGGFAGSPLLRILPSLGAAAIFLSFFFGGVSVYIFRPLTILSMITLAIIMFLGSITWLSAGAPIMESFLGRSLSMVAILSGAAIASNNLAKEMLLKAIFPLIIITSFLGIGFLLLRSLDLAFTNYSHILREESIIFIAGLIWIFKRYPSTILRLLIISTLVFISLKTGKATITLLAIIFAALTFGGDIMRKITKLHEKKISKGVIWTIYVFVTISIGSIIAYLASITILERITRYKYDLRLKMWELRWEQFLESPIFGNFFYGSPIYYDPLLPGLALPTHNDPLDLLAFGGIFAFIIFLLAILTNVISSYGFKQLISSGKELKKEAIFWIYLATYMVSSIGNPYFSYPRIIVIIWFALGFVAMQRYQQHLAARKKSAFSTSFTF